MLSQVHEDIGSFPVESQDVEMSQRVDAALQFEVGVRLVMAGPLTIQQSEPAAQRFLGSDDAGEDIRPTLINAGEQAASAAETAINGQFL